MGLRLRQQIIILFVALIALSIVVVSYFNIGVFRLSFLADEDHRLRHLGQQTADKILAYLGPIYLEPNGATGIGPSQNFDYNKVPDLRYFELWSPDGKVLYRAGRVEDELPLRESLLRRLRVQPLPTHLFLSGKRNGGNDAANPYSDSLPPASISSKGRLTYEYILPIFEPHSSLKADLDKEPAIRLKALLHMSFDAHSSSRRFGLVIAGNILLGITFLLTSLMSVHLWSQHAISRPLQGLISSMRQFDGEQKKIEMSSTNELINISQTLHHLALDRLKYQRELEGLNRDLEAQVEEKTLEMKEFFSLVTHDLRIPLAAIQGYTDLLKRKADDLSERQLTYVSRISTANSHALELVRNLLEAMKIEFGTLEPIMEVFDFETLATEVRDQLNVDEGVPKVVLDGPEAGLKIRVEADRTRIKRVLTNLLSNAQRHAGGTQDVRLYWKLDDAKRVRVEVKDKGPGIPGREQKRLFEKFTRTPDSKANSSGLGLGLYIVKCILDSHQQEITVQSELGQGTTFAFCLPIRGDHLES